MHIPVNTSELHLVMSIIISVQFRFMIMLFLSMKSQNKYLALMKGGRLELLHLVHLIPSFPEGVLDVVFPHWWVVVHFVMDLSS